MKRFVILLLLQTWSVMLFAEEPKQKVPRYPNEVLEVAWRDELVERANRELVVKMADFENATFDEALEWLMVAYGRGQPNGFGLNMSYRVVPNDKSNVKLKFDKPRPFFEVLDNLCQQAGYYWKVGPQAVEISTKEIISKKESDP